MTTFLSQKHLTAPRFPTNYVGCLNLMWALNCCMIILLMALLICKNKL